MVRQRVDAAVVVLPQGGDRRVDVVQDLVGCLLAPAGPAAGCRRGGDPRDGRIVDQAGGVHLLKTLVHVPVDELVAVQPDAFVQEGLRIPPDAHHLLALHDAERHVFREVEGPGHRFGHVRLDDGDVVRGVEEEVVVLSAGGSIGHVDGRDGFDQPAAGDHGHIPGPLGRGQRLEDGPVDLLELLHQEGGDVVGTAGHAPAQGDGLADPL